MELRNVRELRRMERAITLGWLLGAGRIFLSGFSRGRVLEWLSDAFACRNPPMSFYGAKIPAEWIRRETAVECFIPIIDNGLRFMWYI